jgi:hypothetical protein
VIVKRPDYHIFGMYESVADLPVALDDIRDQLSASSSPQMLARVPFL